MTTGPVLIPGKFMDFLRGSGIMADPRSYDDSYEALTLGTKLREAPALRRGRGTTHPVELSRPEAVLLDELVGWCLDANSDEPDSAEVSAALRVRERIDAYLRNL